MRDQNAPIPVTGIMDINPYVTGKSFVPGSTRIIKLSSNETPIGPSAKAVEAFRGASEKLERYPDGSVSALREAIANKYQISFDNVICGTGSDDILNLLARAFLRSGDEAIVTEHGFLIFQIATLSTGARPIKAPEINCHANVDALLEKVTTRTKVVYLANPNNPTGTYVPYAEICRLREELPSSVLLILDAAYAEYIDQEDYNPGMELVQSGNNTVMTRTFSKVFGLASLRLGWAYAPSNIIDVLNRIRGPFNVCSPAIASAVAVLEDQAYLDKAIKHNSEWRPWLQNQIEALSLKVTPSIANFLLVHFKDENAKRSGDADRFLQEHGIILRPVADYGLPNALRLTVGTEEENRIFIQILSKFLDNDI